MAVGRHYSAYNTSTSSITPSYNVSIPTHNVDIPTYNFNLSTFVSASSIQKYSRGWDGQQDQYQNRNKVRGPLEELFHTSFWPEKKKTEPIAFNILVVVLHDWKSPDYAAEILKVRPRINYYLVKFTDQSECAMFINRARIEHIFLIVTGSASEQASAFIAKLRRKVTFYILVSSAPRKGLSAPVSIYFHIQALLRQLAIDLEVRNNDMTQILLFPPNCTEQSTRDVNQEGRKYWALEIILAVFLRIPVIERQAYRYQLIDALKECNVQYSSELSSYTYEDFLNSYSHMNVVHWYTCDSFVYRQLNQILRNDNLNFILLFGFYIADLHQELVRLHDDYLEKQSSWEATIKIYRGQHIAPKELEAIKKMVGGTLAFNTFLSTTASRNVAMIYAGDGSRRPQYESVLFVIECDNNRCFDTPFADVSRLSCIPDEEELLFTMGTIFLINSVEQIDYYWEITVEVINRNKDEKCFTIMNMINTHLDQADISSKPLNGIINVDVRKKNKIIDDCYHKVFFLVGTRENRNCESRLLVRLAIYCGRLFGMIFILLVCYSILIYLLPLPSDHDGPKGTVEL